MVIIKEITFVVAQSDHIKRLLLYLKTLHPNSIPEKMTLHQRIGACFTNHLLQARMTQAYRT